MYYAYRMKKNVTSKEGKYDDGRKKEVKDKKL